MPLFGYYVAVWQHFSKILVKLTMAHWIYNITGQIILSIIAAAFIIYLPLCIYFSYPLFKRRNEVIFKKRYVGLSLWTIGSMLLTMIVDSINMLFRFHLIHVVTPSMQYIVNITQAIYLIFLALTITLMLLRIWLIYFDCNYNSIVCCKNWKSIINNKHNAMDSFWVIRKSSFGNLVYMIRIQTVNMILVSAICIVGLTVPALDGLEIIVESELILCFVFICVIYCKLRRVQFFDHFHILAEFRLAGIASIVLITMSIVLYTIFITLRSMKVFSSSSTNELSADIVLLAIHQLFYLLICWAIYTMTRWVIQKVENDPALRKQYGHLMSPKTVISPTVGSSSSTNLTPPSKTFTFTHAAITLAHAPNSNSNHHGKQHKALTLQMILENDEYLLPYMLHLSHEFSIECILSLIEFIQFKQCAQSEILERADSNASETDDGEEEEVDDDDIVIDRMNSNFFDMLNIKLAPSIPPSSIVHSKETLPMKARLLFQKYVAIGAQYEINIQSRIRSQLMHKYGIFRPNLLRASIGGAVGGGAEAVHQRHISSVDLSGVEWTNAVLACEFDECCMEMRMLLGYSLSRFKSSADYVRLQQHL